MPSEVPFIHAGEILKEEHLDPMGISEYRLAKDIHVPAPRINEITHGKRGISPDTALRLARYFGTTVEMWQNLQAHYDTEIQREQIADQLADITPVAS